MRHLLFLSEAGFPLGSGFVIGKFSNFSLAGGTPGLDRDESLPLLPCLRTPSPISLVFNLLFLPAKRKDPGFWDAVRVTSLLSVTLSFVLFSPAPDSSLSDKPKEDGTLSTSLLTFGALFSRVLAITDRLVPTQEV
uniref:Uncharacterized protein n=1 Tax=Rhizophora mucronata TaxID=61149 RepID=A0A2P2MTB4_RHIMU